MTDGEGGLAAEIHELQLADLLKLGFAGIIVYGGYRLVKKLTRSEEDD